MKNPSLLKFNRILYLLNLFQRGRVNLVSQAAQLGVSVRTLQRDVSEIEKAGFPVCSSVPGVYGFVEGFSLDKMPLSRRESSLLTLMEQLSESLGAPWLASFNRFKSNTVRPADSNTFYIKLSAESSPVTVRLTETLERCLFRRERISILYAGKKQSWCRNLRPLKIMLFDGFWYLLAMADTGTYMKFLLSNILRVCPLGTFFEPVNVDKTLAESVNIWFDGGREICISLRVSAGVARYFKKRQYFPLQHIEREFPDGSLELSCKTANFMEILPAIKSWLPDITVLSPRALAEELLAQLQTSVCRHKSVLDKPETKSTVNNVARRTDKTVQKPGVRPRKHK